MTKSHNKKRNIGIIYELLLRNISSNLIAKRVDEAQQTLDLLSSRFNKSSELYREFRLFNALANASVSDTAIAAGILAEAKKAARRCDLKKLNHEKSMLIREINHALKDDDFYRRKIKNYRSYATIQTLLNDWRAGDSADLSRVIKYESQVVQRLLESKTEPVDISSLSDPGIDSLVVKIMAEKLNAKYGDSLSESQKDIIRTYVFSISEDGGDTIRKKLSKIKSSVLNEMKTLREKTDNKVLLEKIEGVNQKIIDQNVDQVDDNSISRFLTISRLRKEILESINE